MSNQPVDPPVPPKSFAQQLAEHLQKVPIGDIRRVVRHSEESATDGEVVAEFVNARQRVSQFLNKVVLLRDSAANERNIEEFERAIEHATSAVGDTRRARLVKVYAEFFGKANATEDPSGVGDV